MITDIRTILLAKVKPGNINSYNKIFSNNVSQNNYITIGNYDALSIYKTEDYSTLWQTNSPPNAQYDNILKCFEAEKRILSELYASENYSQNSPDAFYHPLHVLCKGNETELNEFWNSSKGCVSITLVYGTNDYTSITDLEEHIKKSMTINNDEYLIYRSINLSELVVICKHNSLNKILSSITQITYKSPSLQTHTLCGFKYVSNINDSFISTENIDNESLDMVKISGIIRSHKEAYGLFEQISQKYGKPLNDKYIAFGNNDFNLIYSNVKTHKIIETLNQWITEYHDISVAFFSIKTRIHIKFDETNANTNNFVYVQDMQNLINKAQKIVFYCSKKQPNYTAWVYPFVETLNMLSDMCKNPSLSRIQYFTANTLYVFEKTLSERFKTDPKGIFLTDNEMNLNDFASGFNALIERVVRVDGYLSQEPGYSPLIYNMVPAGILEYYCAYIYEVTKIANDFSETKDSTYNYATLPLPLLDCVISFFDILPHPTDPNQSNQVNILEIPYRDLYHPKQLLFSSTHEVMHFCGEDIRCRKERYNCLLWFLTEYLVREFDVSSIRTEAAPYIYACLKSKITISDNDTDYFDLLLPNLKEAIRDVYNDVDLKNTLIALSAKANKTNKDYFKSNHIKWINQRSSQMSLLDLLDHAIVYLFRECYADLMTVLFLGLDSQDYCNIIDALDIYKHQYEEPESNILVSALLTLRKALVVHTIHGINCTDCDSNIIKLCDIFSEYNDNKNVTDKMNEFAKEFCGSELWELHDYSFAELFFDINSINHLINYLAECANTFKLLCCENSRKLSIDKIRKFYTVGSNSNELFSDDYCNFIYEIRRDIDNKIKTS